MHRRTILDRINTGSIAIAKVDENPDAIRTCDAIIAISRYLSDLGIGPQDRVAIIMDNSSQLALLYTACLCSRVVICPIDKKSQPAEMQYCLSITNPKFVFTDGQTLENLPVGVKVFSLEGDFWETHSTGHEFAQIDYEPDDIFSITFTSGTSGKPKAIVHRGETMLQCAYDFNAFTACDSSAVFLHVMPMYYMAGLLNTILCPLLAGSTLFIGKAFGPMSPFTFWQTWLDNNISHTWLSPTMISAIVTLDRANALRKSIQNQADQFRIFAGTAPMSSDLKQIFCDTYGIKLIESYGLSETLYVSVKEPADNSFNGSVGYLLPGSNLTILETGELAFNSTYTMAGYLQADGTILEVKDNIFYSGDVGKIVDKELYITGRIKDLIIKGGININAREIEEQLEGVPEISQIAIKGYADDFYGENIACFYCGELSQGDLRKICAAKLDKNKIPERFIKMPSLPIGPTGKVKKHELHLQNETVAVKS